MAARGHAERCKQHSGVHPDLGERSVHHKGVGVMGACSARVEVEHGTRENIVFGC